MGERVRIKRFYKSYSRFSLLSNGLFFFFFSFFNNNLQSILTN